MSIKGTVASVLAIVVLTTSCSAGYKVEEFSEDALKDLNLIYPNSLNLNATFINPHFRLKLHRPEISDGDTFILKPNPIQNQLFARDHKDCIQYHGIDVNYGGGTFCRIKYFGLKVTTSEDNTRTYIEFIMLFQSSDSGRSLLFVVPVFKMPSAYASINIKQLTNWAHEARVGIHSPINLRQLQKLLCAEPITLYFEWLDEVLAYGIRDTGLYHPKMDIFASRPIVLSEEATKGIVKLAEHTLEKKVRTNPVFSQSFLNAIRRLA